MKETSKSIITQGVVKIFKITLSDRFARTQGNPYRIIAVPSNLSLYKFANIILENFDFDFDHCFGFFDNLKNIYDSVEGYELFKDIGEETEFQSVKKTKIDKVFNNRGKIMCFMFDYGDDWRFIVEYEKDESVPDIKNFPKLIESKGNAPEQYPDYNEEN
jgi:hypothetical protein